LVKICMKNAKTWKTCVGAMANLVGEIVLKLTPEGIRARAIDPSHVALVDLELPAAALDGYEIGQPTSLGVNLLEMSKIMARAKPTDEMTIELDEQKNRLALTFRGATTRKFDISLIDIREAELPEPKLQFVASAGILAGMIQEGLKDAELVSGTIKLLLDNEGFVMSAEGDKGTTELALGKDNKALTGHDAKQSAKSMYDIGQLGNMVKAAASADIVTVNMGTDLPIQVDCPVADGKGRLRFILAPRIDNAENR